MDDPQTVLAEKNEEKKGKSQMSQGGIYRTLLSNIGPLPSSCLIVRLIG